MTDCFVHHKACFSSLLLQSVIKILAALAWFLVYYYFLNKISLQTASSTIQWLFPPEKQKYKQCILSLKSVLWKQNNCFFLTEEFMKDSLIRVHKD